METWIWENPWHLGSLDAEAERILQENPQQAGEPDFAYIGRICKLLPEPEDRHQFTFDTRERYEPVPLVTNGMHRWREMRGLPHPQVNIADVPAPLEKGHAVAHEFDHAPDMAHDKSVQLCYNDFKHQNEDMYDFITTPRNKGGLGIRVHIIDASDGEPYHSAEEQADDVRHNNNFNVQTGLGGNHSLMSREEYDRFRAVHDIFGHVGVGGGFDRHGEYQAWLAHMGMYVPPGQRAMASEYHGINSSLWAGQGTPTGKALILPQELITNPWNEDGTLRRESKATGMGSALAKALRAKGKVHRGPHFENLHRKQYQVTVKRHKH